MRGYLTAAAIGAALALGASPASAATVLGAGWNTGCGKATCFDDSGVFTQTFSASSFSGRVTIGQLLLERGVLGALDTSMFRLSFTQNGEEVGTWGKFLMGGIGGDVLSFTGEAFEWNPEDGDLVLVLTLSPPSRPGAGGFRLSSLDPGFAPAQRETADSPFAPEPNDLVVTQQDVGQHDAGSQAIPTAVPEPATWALMVGGFGLAGAALRRRREAAA